MGRETHPAGGLGSIREIVYVCDGVALGFMFGIPTAALVLGRLSWSIVLVSFIGWAAMIALVTSVGRWIESDAAFEGEDPGGSTGPARALGLRES